MNGIGREKNTHKKSNTQEERNAQKKAEYNSGSSWAGRSVAE